MINGQRGDVSGAVAGEQLVRRREEDRGENRGRSQAFQGSPSINIFHVNTTDTCREGAPPEGGAELGLWQPQKQAA
jgi:hypothetical protein